MSRCKRCGGSLVVDDGEMKCLACGQPVGDEGLGGISAEEALEQVEMDREADWAEYVAGRRETASARYGKGTPESRAEYNRRYYLAHHEKALADVIRWNRSHKAVLKEYRRGYRSFIAYGVCSVCGMCIHFSREYGWCHSRKDRAWHKAEVVLTRV